MGYSFRENRITLAEGDNRALGYAKFALVAELCGLITFEDIKDNWIKAFEVLKTSAGVEEFKTWFSKARYDYLLLEVRLYGKYHSLERFVLETLNKVLIAEEPFCDFLGMAGDCEGVACFHNTEEDCKELIARAKKETGRVALSAEATAPLVVTTGKQSRPQIIRTYDYPLAKQAAVDLDQDIVPKETDLISAFQRFLDNLTGKACKDYEDNQELVKLVNGRANRYGMSLICLDMRKRKQELLGGLLPHYVNLYCEQPPPRSKTGVFTARTRLHGKSHPISAGPLFPQLIAWHGEIGYLS